MSNDTTKSRDALDKAIRNAAIMRTEQVTLQAPDARALRDALSDPILAARVEEAEAARQSAEARVEALERALEALIPLARAWEFVETRSYSYGNGHTEPREWGIALEYRQTREADPQQQFADDVESFHANWDADLEEGDPWALASQTARQLLGQFSPPKPADQVSVEGGLDADH